MDKPNSLLDPRFKYVSSSNTNIAKTFARIRREQARVAIVTKATVVPIKKERQQA